MEQYVNRAEAGSGNTPRRIALLDLGHEVVVADPVLHDQLRRADDLGDLGVRLEGVRVGLGLLMIPVTETYWPPIWPITSAYSFSAPTATIFLADPCDAVLPLVSALSRAGAAGCQ